MRIIKFLKGKKFSKLKSRIGDIDPVYLLFIGGVFVIVLIVFSKYITETGNPYKENEMNAFPIFIFSAIFIGALIMYFVMKSDD